MFQKIKDNWQLVVGTIVATLVIERATIWTVGAVQKKLAERKVA
jgi:hypothetical protein